MPRQAMDFASMGANIGRQIMDAGNAQESAQTNMGLLLAKQFQAQSAAERNNAQAGYYKTKGDIDRQRAQYQTPEFATKFAGTLAGLNDQQAGQMEDFSKSGSWGMNPAMPDEEKQMTVVPTPKAAPDFYTPELKAKYDAGKAAHMLNLGATGDSNADQVAKAVAELLGQGRIDSAIADPSKAAAFGQAMAASKGAPLYHAGPNGTMQLFTGQENLNDVGRSAAKENIAQAANAYASANNSNSSAALHKAQIPEVQSRIDLNKSKAGQPTVNADGSITGPANIAWKYDAGSDEFVAPPTPEFPNGRRSGNIAKLNASNSLDYVISQFGADVEGSPAEKGKTLLDTTPQGGAFGVAGYIGKATDSQKGKRFDNLREQLSTELRTLFRIPGEGALSDREQAQYGVQLPSVTNDKSTNVAILNDIQARVKLRQDQGANPLVRGSNQANTAPDSASTTPTDAAIDHLKKNPNLAPAFAAKYGKNATDAALGKVR